MNLGQLIGELMVKGASTELEAVRVPHPSLNVSTRPSSIKGPRQQQIHAYLAESGGATRQQVAAACEMTEENALTLLHTMQVGGLVSRTGSRRHFVYHAVVQP